MCVNKHIDSMASIAAVAAIVRCLRIRGGMVALSPSRNCMYKKMEMRIPNPRKHPHTFELDQGKDMPPHWRASSNETIPLIRKVAPRKSSSFNFCFTGIWVCFLMGLLKKYVDSMARPPNGRLICFVWELMVLSRFKTYPKAPSPSQSVDKNSSQNRTHNWRDPKHA